MQYILVGIKLNVMTVQELSMFLSSLSPKTEIFLSQDPEGNGYERVDYDLAEFKLKNGDKAVILFPVDRGKDFEEFFKYR